MERSFSDSDLVRKSRAEHPVGAFEPWRTCAFSSVGYLKGQDSLLKPLEAPILGNDDLGSVQRLPLP